MLPDGFNWSPLARSREQESLPTNGGSCNKSDTSHALATYMFTVIHMRVFAHSPVWAHKHSYTHVLSKHLIQQGTIPTLSVSLLSAFRHKSIPLKTCHRDLILCEYRYPRKPCWKDELFQPRAGCLILPVQRLFATSKKGLKERDARKNTFAKTFPVKNGNSQIQLHMKSHLVDDKMISHASKAVGIIT